MLREVIILRVLPVINSCALTSEDWFVAMLCVLFNMGLESGLVSDGKAHSSFVVRGPPHKTNAYEASLTRLVIPSLW
jgi:hypothetical protein